jgi:hypothetical protein
MLKYNFLEFYQKNLIYHKTYNFKFAISTNFNFWIWWFLPRNRRYVIKISSFVFLNALRILQKKNIDNLTIGYIYLRDMYGAVNAEPVVMINLL